VDETKNNMDQMGSDFWKGNGVCCGLIPLESGNSQRKPRQLSPQITGNSYKNQSSIQGAACK